MHTVPKTERSKCTYKASAIYIDALNDAWHIEVQMKARSDLSSFVISRIPIYSAPSIMLDINAKILDPDGCHAPNRTDTVKTDGSEPSVPVRFFKYTFLNRASSSGLFIKIPTSEENIRLLCTGVTEFELSLKQAKHTLVKSISVSAPDV